jgi:AbrB family looped-hinge helix DNA binding protein
MIIELRKKAQITIPKEIVTALGLAEGAALEIKLDGGVIRIEPVAVYSQRYVRTLEQQVTKLPSMPDKYGEGPDHAEEGIPYLQDPEPGK